MFCGDGLKQTTRRTPWASQSIRTISFRNREHSWKANEIRSTYFQHALEGHTDSCPHGAHKFQRGLLFWDRLFGFHVDLQRRPLGSAGFAGGEFACSSVAAGDGRGPLAGCGHWGRCLEKLCRASVSALLETWQTCLLQTEVLQIRHSKCYTLSNLA